MKTQFLRRAVITALVCGALGAALVGTAEAQPKNKGGKPAKDGKSDKGGKPKAERFAVVRVGDKVEVVEQEELKELRAKLDREFKQQQEDYKQRKAAAKKSKEKFAEPRPKKPAFKVLKKGLKSREQADGIARKMAEKGKGGASGPKGKSTGWVVVAKDGGGHEVIERAQLDARNRDAVTAHAAAIKDWTQRKKTAAKEKRKFGEARPKKPKAIKPVGTYKTEELARAALAKLEKRSGKGKDKGKSGAKGKGEKR